MIHELLPALFFAIILYDSYYFVIFFYQSFKKTQSEYSPPVSVIVPVYNEELTIQKCIESLLNSEYNAQIIVVDDGSTDRTKDILDSLNGITVYTIPHSGKAAALNYGILHSSGDIVVVDADTVVEKDTIRALVRTLAVYDAVAGNLQVSTPKGILSRCQAVEHVRIAMFRKVAQYFDDIDIVPGPIGAFKREVFAEIQYGTSIVEDMELTQNLREKFTVGYAQEARAYTEMPERWMDFLRQRVRWAKGSLELLLKRRLSFSKIVPGYLIAFADILFVLLCLLNRYYLFLSLFFLVESFTMVVGTYKEKAKYYIESVFFPFFMLFLDGIFLLSHGLGILLILRESSGSLLQRNRPRT